MPATPRDIERYRRATIARSSACPRTTIPQARLGSARRRCRSAALRAGDILHESRLARTRCRSPLLPRRESNGGQLRAQAVVGASIRLRQRRSPDLRERFRPVCRRHSPRESLIYLPSPRSSFANHTIPPAAILAAAWLRFPVANDTSSVVVERPTVVKSCVCSGTPIRPVR